MKKLGICCGLAPQLPAYTPWHVVSPAAWPKGYRVMPHGNLAVTLDLTEVRPHYRYTPQDLADRAIYWLNRAGVHQRLLGDPQGATLVCWATPINGHNLTGWADDDPSAMQAQIGLWRSAVSILRTKWPQVLWGGPSLAPTLAAQTWGYHLLEPLYREMDFIPMAMHWDRTQAAQLGDRTWDAVGMPWIWSRRTCDRPVFLTRVARPFWRGTADATQYRRELLVIDYHLAQMPNVLGGGVWADSLPPSEGVQYQWHGTRIQSLWHFPQWSNRHHQRRLVRSFMKLRVRRVYSMAAISSSTPPSQTPPSTTG